MEKEKVFKYMGVWFNRGVVQQGYASRGMGWKDRIDDQKGWAE